MFAFAIYPLSTKFMTYQQTDKIPKYARVWAIILMLPDARHYTVARFYNRRDGEVHQASFAAVYAKV